MSTEADAARIACHICDEYATGNRGGIQIGHIHFELSEVARCSEFVRECIEAAAGTVDHGPYSWRYFGGSARETETKLRRAGVKISRKDAQPGSIICFNWGNAGEWGHIGLWRGGPHDEFYENTSSKRRGPGFVISRLTQIGWHRVSGFYSVLEPAHIQEKLLWVNYMGEYLPQDAAELREDETWVKLREVVAREDALSSSGRVIHWRPNLKKVFVKTREG